MTYYFLSFTPLWNTLHLLHLNNFKCILISHILVVGFWLTHLLWNLHPRHLNSAISQRFAITLRKSNCSSRNPIPFIISWLIIIYLHPIFCLFPPSFLFLFLRECMRLFHIKARNMQWLRKWLFHILLAHRIWSLYLLGSPLLDIIGFRPLRFVNMVRWITLMLMLLPRGILRSMTRITMKIFL